VIVQASVRVIIVGQLWQVADSFMGLLQDGDADGHVVCRSQVLSTGVLEIFLSYIPEELCVEGTQVTSDEGVVAVSVLLLGGGREGTGKANSARSAEKVGVNKP
jgi:hypothetical protein